MIDLESKSITRARYQKVAQRMSYWIKQAEKSDNFEQTMEFYKTRYEQRLKKKEQQQLEEKAKRRHEFIYG